MSHRSPPTPEPQHPPSKRARASSPDKDSPVEGPEASGPASPTNEASQEGAGGGQGGKIGQSSNFRNVSACNRCRLRKNRCDQKLPSCASCEKARVSCVGYDPITKREIPRSYVYYLETRVGQLEALLESNNISFPPAENLEYCARPGPATSGRRSSNEGGHLQASEKVDHAGASQGHGGNDSARSNRAGRQGGSSAQKLLSTNGVTFARVVFAAVQSSVGDQRSSSEKTGVRPYKPIAGNAGGNGPAELGTSMRDSFFGLHTRPTINLAEFPEKQEAMRMVSLYFEHANPQIPVLHRDEFMRMFELAYAEEGRIRGPRELYMLNMVFAIGGGIIMGSPAAGNFQSEAEGDKQKHAQPEEYHASAIVHLEACLSNSGGGLEELQAVLLLANFALLRPVPPGLWYIVGVAVRLAVDLGLHYEDGKDVQPGLGGAVVGLRGGAAGKGSQEMHARERGRREYVRDLRRRLWWCTYSFDRLVSTCVGRPFGITDQVITTEFPSLYDDKYITSAGIATPPETECSYKIVAHHYWRLRLLQSEILQVLQYQQAQIARVHGQNIQNIYMHTQLPSPFLQRFESFRAWRLDIDRRLLEWKNSAPNKRQSGVSFSVEFLELNYWQAIVMLYRQSLSVPTMFEGEYHTEKEVNSPSIHNQELGEDEERVYVKVAEAGQKILRLYRQLHLQGVVNYTYLATHHLFMAGISYLYAIWHSAMVRSRLTMDEVDFTILAATSVFTDLIDKCPPAEACRDAFDRTAKATIKMATTTGGFGQVYNRQKRGSKGGQDRVDYLSAREATMNGGRPSHRSTLDQAQRPAMQYNAAMQEGFATSGPAAVGSVPAMQSNQFRLAMPNIKTEQDGYSMMRSMPGPARSAGSGSDAGMTPDNSAIDPVLLPSPVGGNMNSPISVTSMTPAAGGAVNQLPAQNAGAYGNILRSPSGSYTPGTSLNYSELQGMDILQSLQSGGGQGMDGEMAGDGNMDLNFGLGWEGMGHDFSDGQQQVDLFDGFFFGGQQGGGGGPGM